MVLSPLSLSHTFGFGHLPFNLTLTLSLVRIHSLSHVLVVMMKSKELKTKISHAQSLILSLPLFLSLTHLLTHSLSRVRVVIT